MAQSAIVQCLVCHSYFDNLSKAEKHVRRKHDIDKQSEETQTLRNNSDFVERVGVVERRRRELPTKKVTFKDCFVSLDRCKVDPALFHRLKVVGMEKSDTKGNSEKMRKQQSTSDESSKSTSAERILRQCRANENEQGKKATFTQFFEEEREDMIVEKFSKRNSNKYYVDEDFVPEDLTVIKPQRNTPRKTSCGDRYKIQNRNNLVRNQLREKACKPTENKPSKFDQPEYQKKAFPCPSYLMKFKYADNLLRHLRMENNPYVCTFPHCNTRFNSRYDLKRHKLLHSQSFAKATETECSSDWSLKRHLPVAHKPSDLLTPDGKLADSFLERIRHRRITRRARICDMFSKKKDTKHESENLLNSMVENNESFDVKTDTASVPVVEAEIQVKVDPDGRVIHPKRRDTIQTKVTIEMESEATGEEVHLVIDPVSVKEAISPVSHYSSENEDDDSILVAETIAIVESEAEVEVKKKTERRGRKPAKYNKNSLVYVKDKVLRKKEQNKTAATRYRLKKKQELACTLAEEDDLQEVHDELSKQKQKLGSKISVIRSLLVAETIAIVEPEAEVEVKKKTERRGRKPAKYNKNSLVYVKDKVLRKKEQNKTAAIRYRVKKKQELACTLAEEDDLQEVHDELSKQKQKLGSEISVIRSLLREMLSARKQRISPGYLPNLPL